MRLVNNPIPLLISILTLSTASYAKESNSDALSLNQQGIAAMEKIHCGHDYRENLTEDFWKGMFAKFEDALRIDPKFTVARENLAIAHNNYALFLASHEHKMDEALKEFHRSIYINPNMSTNGSMNILIRRYFKKDPNKFSDRISLANKAKTDKDLIGAAVEYNAALKLKDDRDVHKKLGDIYKSLDDKEKAIAEYTAAYKDSN